MAELTLATLAAQVFTGLVLGMILVLLAIGLSLIFGLMTVVNFAHGSLYMLGAYLGFFLIGYTKSFWLALVVAPLLVGAFGLAVERFLVRPLYRRPSAAHVRALAGDGRDGATHLGQDRPHPRPAARARGRRQPRLHVFPSLSPLRHRRDHRRTGGALPLPREDQHRPHHPRGLTPMTKR